MFYLDQMRDDAHGFNSLSKANEWTPWLHATVPSGWSSEVKSRLVSNLKHTLVGLEMKAGLILPQQATRRTRQPSLLFEPYFQVMTFEFCVGTFSVCEGLGSALHLAATGGDPELSVVR